MTLTEEPIETPEEQLFQQVRHRIDKVVERLAARHSLTNTQEPQITARLAQAIQEEFQHSPIAVPGLELEVETQDFGDRGPGSPEHRSGADLYISIVRRGIVFEKSKGILVQAKKISTLYIKQEQDRLREQCRRMRRRSPESYVWFLDDDGVRVIKASTSIRAIERALNDEPPSVGDLIADGLRCNKGDEQIGRPFGASLARIDQRNHEPVIGKEMAQFHR